MYDKESRVNIGKNVIQYTGYCILHNYLTVQISLSKNL